MDFTQHYMKCSDLKATYWMVGIALLGACVISFVWILLMRFLAGGQLYCCEEKLMRSIFLGAMVYTSILTVFLGVGSLLGYCSYNLYNIWPSDDPETNKNIFQVIFPQTMF